MDRVRRKRFNISLKPKYQAAFGIKIYVGKMAMRTLEFRGIVQISDSAKAFRSFYGDIDQILKLWR